MMDGRRKGMFALNRMCPAWGCDSGSGSAVLMVMQFFISYAKQPSLDGKYTIFGR